MPNGRPAPVFFRANHSQSCAKMCGVMRSYAELCGVMRSYAELCADPRQHQPRLGPRHNRLRDPNRLRLADISRAQLVPFTPVGVPVWSMSRTTLAGATRRFAAFTILKLIRDMQICGQLGHILATSPSQLTAHPTTHEIFPRYPRRWLRRSLAVCKTIGVTLEALVWYFSSNRQIQLPQSGYQTGTIIASDNPAFLGISAGV